MSLRILHVITGLEEGGAEAVLYRLVVCDEPHRHHVVSLTGRGKYGPLLRQAGTRVTCLNMPRRRLTLRGLWRLWRILRAERPHVVQTWMYHGDLVGGVVARLAGVRNIVWGIHHTNLEPGKVPRSTIWVARLNARLSHWVPKAIVAVAERAKEVHAALGYAAHKIVVIPNGYDFNRFCPDEEARARLRGEWGVPERVFLVGMVARFDPQKDHANLLEALARLEDLDFRCALVGRGLTPDNREIVDLVRGHDLEERVLLLGSRSDIPAVMNALDLHVLSSAGEAFPNVVAEAMACGTPCVVTDVGDASLIVGETGWVVPPRDPSALAQAIRAAWEEWRTRGGDWFERKAKARARVVERFSIERMAGAYREVWRRAAGESERRD